jgi:hypothetical protein
VAWVLRDPRPGTERIQAKTLQGAGKPIGTAAAIRSSFAPKDHLERNLQRSHGADNGSAQGSDAALFTADGEYDREFEIRAQALVLLGCLS